MAKISDKNLKDRISPEKMKVLLIGRWGKTHAIAKALAKSKNIELYCLMDKKNGGIASLADHFELCDIKNINAVEDYVDKHKIEMIVVVPAASLEQGMTDYFNKKGIPSIGASEFCTRLEGDKGFLRMLMKENDIDGYPDFQVFSNKQEAVKFIIDYPEPFAVKPAGITEGDGVKVIGIQLRDKTEAIEYVNDVFDNAIGNKAAVIIEKKIEGEEYTIQFFSDGKNLVPMPATRDYKLLNKGDTGLNTPGMGSYSCADHSLPFLSKQAQSKSIDIIEKIFKVLRDKYNEVFKGFLSGQYMITGDGVMLIEINVRPGDSEILNITPVLKTDFLEICKAIHSGRLDEIEILFEKKATVCKYVVPDGFPAMQGNCKIKINRKMIDNPEAELFQSCFEAGEDMYEPSPRLFAITGIGNNLAEANENCENGISCISGKNIFHREDIGTPGLTYKYREHKFISDVLPGFSADVL